MKATDIHDYARQLQETHGIKAIVEAAQKAVSCESIGKPERAKTWRRVEAALREMKGPRES